MSALEHLTLHLRGISDCDFPILPRIKQLSVFIRSDYETALLRTNLVFLPNLESLAFSRAESRELILSLTLPRLTDLTIYHYQGDLHQLTLADFNQMLNRVPNLQRLRLEKFTITSFDSKVKWPSKLKYLDLRKFQVPDGVFNLPNGLVSLQMQLCSPCRIDDASTLERAIVQLVYRFETSFLTTLLDAFENQSISYLVINRIRNAEYERLRSSHPTRILIRDQFDIFDASIFKAAA